MVQKILQIKSMWMRWGGIPFHVGGKIRAKHTPTCSDTSEKIVQMFHCTKLSSGQPFHGSQQGLEQKSFPEHKPKHYPTSGTAAEAGSSLALGDAGLESSAEICFLHPAWIKSSEQDRNSCFQSILEECGFPLLEEILLFNLLHLREGKGNFLSALRKISHSTEIQLNYERARQNFTINTDCTYMHIHIGLSFTDYN